MYRVETLMGLNEKELLAVSIQSSLYKREPGFAYLLLLWMGWLGAHKLYMDQPVWAGAYLLLSFGGGALIFLGTATTAASASGSNSSAAAGGMGLALFGVIPFLILGLLLLIDFFIIPSRCDDLERQNVDRSVKALVDLRPKTPTLQPEEPAP